MSEPSLRSPGCSVCEWTGRHVGSIFPGPCPHCSKPTTTPRDTHWSKRRKHVRHVTIQRAFFDMARARREFMQAVVKAVRRV